MQRCDTPLLLAATRCAIGLAEARGWSAATIAGVFYGLKAVLDGHAGGGPVPLSQVRQRVRPRSHSSATRIAHLPMSGPCVFRISMRFPAYRQHRRCSSVRRPIGRAPCS